MNEKKYPSILSERYADAKMAYLFSDEFKIQTWRELWIALAIEQKNLGLAITQEQIDELVTYQKNINYDEAMQIEKIIKHEVMSHIRAYGSQCPKAKKIIHLGATSAYVLDNTDIIVMKKAMFLIKSQLLKLIHDLSQFCLKYKSVATLGYTHFQPAQPVTVGKRASLWLQDLIYDYHQWQFQIDNLPFLGVKGTTGTQDSFIQLFNGDEKKVQLLDWNVTRRMGFDKNILVTGQTYSRKIDFFILSALSGIAQSSSKFSQDMRLLQNHRELEEPFDKEQVGSSAMPYKKNPMRAERITSLSRYVIVQAQNAALTHATQWLERSLDDSAIKRLSIPESFLSTNAVLKLYQYIIRNLKVNKEQIECHLNEVLPFMSTESILMKSVSQGCDRQIIHEEIRQCAVNSKNGNELIDSLANNTTIPFSKKEIQNIIFKSVFSGRSESQVEEFVKQEVWPILEKEGLSNQKQSDNEITDILI